jgi:hypothetical protein
MAQALTKPSIALTLAPERRRTVTYTRDVAPLVEAKCGNRVCHGNGSMFRPADTSGASRFVRHVLENAALTDDERRTIIEWIDLGAQQ